MFSKPKLNDPIDTGSGSTEGAPKPAAPAAQTAPAATAAPKPKPAPSTISSDLVVTGNVVTTGDMQVDGTIEGDIRAHMLTVGENAMVSGEILADDIVINGHIRGRVRGLKVRLTSTAKVEGDIIHKTIAIEAGAHFEGSVQRRDDPLGDSRSPAPVNQGAAPKAPAPAAKPEAKG